MIVKNFFKVLSRFVKKDFRLVPAIPYANKCPPDHLSGEVEAGIIIIGDEILKGTTDVNTPFLINELKEMNVKIRKVAIVPDNVDDIANEVSDLSSKCAFVITSGGIGPTHDDVTYEAVAKACNVELQLSNDLFKLLVNHFGPDYSDNPGVLKYSHIPKSADLHYLDFNHNNKKIQYPIVSVRNIYVFPGVPGLLQKCFKLFKSRFSVQNQMFKKDIYVDVDEFSLIGILNEAVKIFKNVTFGSYPTFTNNYYKVKLSMESKFKYEINDACMFFSRKLPAGSIVNLKNILLCAKRDVYSLSRVSSQVRLAVSVIEEAMNKYLSSELCVCFNGGKDCTALLHLLYSCFQNVKPKEWSQIHFLYVKNGEVFKEIDTFIQSTSSLYHINLTVMEGDLKEAVASYLQSNSSVKAMFMGTRKCDPGASSLEPFSITDSDWPSIMRIFPILSWTYSDVWFFIRKLHIPYCMLYDHGYTSLGIKSRTVQNPSLQSNNHAGFKFYKPAYMLLDPESERNSRL